MHACVRALESAIVGTRAVLMRWKKHVGLGEYPPFHSCAANVKYNADLNIRDLTLIVAGTVLRPCLLLCSLLVVDRVKSYVPRSAEAPVSALELHLKYCPRVTIALHKALVD